MLVFEVLLVVRYSFQYISYVLYIYIIYIYILIKHYSTAPGGPVFMSILDPQCDKPSPIINHLEYSHTSQTCVPDNRSYKVVVYGKGFEVNLPS